MPRLSLWRSTKTNDYKFFDRTISEMFAAGCLDIFVHKYLGPLAITPGAEGDATQPTTTTPDPMFIEDLLFLENRNRDYDEDIYRLRGCYNVHDLEFDLNQFGLFFAGGDILYVTFHYNDMIDAFGRKLMNGDVLEIPNLKDYHPLDADIPKALPRFYVIQDASFAAEGFSQTWLPHLWRVKAKPLTNTQEFNDILNNPIDEENPDFGSLADFLGVNNTNTSINDAIVNQAEAEVPLSGYDPTKFFVLPTDLEGHPVNPDTNTPKTNGYTVGYLTGDGLPPNGHPVTAGVSFPLGPQEGDYALRLDYRPNRLFRYTDGMWTLIEKNVRTNLTNGPLNQTQRSNFVNNDATVSTTDRGDIPSRQSLSDLLKPQADN